MIYAAKSTEDRRGSIPEQLRECHEAIDTDHRRRHVAEYTDEAVSGYRRDRGPGLRDAIEHAEDLAGEFGVAELWAQHSDRLARGDGRNARHTVEIALWALKHDIRVRTLQDPDTFRDLLYAVVTGQRNNEDSRRKAVATVAGRKRALERGEFMGHLPDGYRIIREFDRDGHVTRRLEFDPVRQPLIELLFRLALRGRTPGQITATISDRGWLTKPVRRIDSPRPFDVAKVNALLRNPRYAALSPFKGEILARGHWPGYISERQHQRICERLSRPQGRRSTGPVDPYLMWRMLTCGHCGEPLRVCTGQPSGHGARARVYVCGGHVQRRGRVQCHAAPIDAHIAEAMLTASLPTLLETGRPDPGLLPATGTYAALTQRTTVSQRRTRELTDTQRFRDWIEQEATGRTDATRALAPQLTMLLRGWFSQIAIKVEPQSVTIATTRRDSAELSERASVTLDRTVWTRYAPPGHRQLTKTKWAPAEMIGALQAWAEEHGHSPRNVDWKPPSASHPLDKTVCRSFGSWERALRQAGLPPAGPPLHRRWSDEQIISALKAWARAHGRAPAYIEWLKGAPGRPAAQTVYHRFGTWTAALVAAGLSPPPRPKSRTARWAKPDILDALRAWAHANGRPPTVVDWVKVTPERPSNMTVRKHFGSWRHALAAADLKTDGHGRALTISMG